MNKEFLYSLNKKLSELLPGEKAQLIMGSGIRMKELRVMPADENTKKSAVMILLYPKNNSIYSVLILRAKYNGTHSGQVSLPGGKFEKCDNDFRETALRETQEEIGVDASKINIVGALTKLFIPPSNFFVFPFVGYLNEEPLFYVNKKEVTEIIEYPISMLINKDIVKSKIFEIKNNISFTAPYFDINGKVVWGATAMILSEFKEVLKKIKL